MNLKLESLSTSCIELDVWNDVKSFFDVATAAQSCAILRTLITESLVCVTGRALRDVRMDTLAKDLVVPNANLVMLICCSPSTVATTSNSSATTEFPPLAMIFPEQ